MTYNFIFEDDYQRIIMATIIEARASIPQIKNQVGSVIKSYVDRQIDLVNDNTIVYKLETEQAVMAGYFTVEVNTIYKRGVLGQFVLRPAFVAFNSEIQDIITNFIMSNVWKNDYLFD